MEKKLDVVVPILGTEDFIQDLDGMYGTITIVYRSSGVEAQLYYTGETIVLDGRVFWIYGAPRVRLYLAHDNPEIGDYVYNIDVEIEADVTYATVYTDLITEENTIYRWHGRYYRRYDNDIVEVTDVEFPSIEKPMELFDFTYDSTRMGTAPIIDATKYWYDWLDDDWRQDCHVHFNGEKYYIKLTPTSTKENTDARYRYQMNFISERVALENVYFYDVVMPYISDRPVSEKSEFSFFGDIKELRKRLNASMVRSGISSYKKRQDERGFDVVPVVLTYAQYNALPSSSEIRQQFTTYEAYLQYAYEYDSTTGEFVIEGYQVVLGYDGHSHIVESEEKYLEFSNNTIHEALQKIKEDFGLQYYVQSGTKNIVVGDNEWNFGKANTFEYGVNNELLSIEKANSTEKIVTRITGIGSEENIPYYYPNPCPDGWIEPIYKRGESELSGLITYDANDEAYLLNRIGRGFKYGRLRGMREFGVDNTIDLTSSTVSSHYTTVLTAAQYNDIAYEIYVVTEERALVRFRNIRCNLGSSTIFKVELQSPQANPYYNADSAARWAAQRAQYIANGADAASIYNPPEVLVIPTGTNLSVAPWVEYKKLSPKIYLTQATYTSTLDINDWTNGDVYLDAGSYRIVYHVRADVNMRYSSSGAISPFPQDVWFAYENRATVAIGTRRPAGEGVVSESGYYPVPMLFSKFNYMMPHWNNELTKWEWYQQGYNSYQEWVSALGEYEISVNTTNYKVATKHTQMVGHPYNSNSTPTVYDRREFRYTFGDNWWELDANTAAVNAPITRYEQNGLTLGVFYNSCMDGTIKWYYEHWYRDNVVVNDFDDYGMTVTGTPQLFDEIVFRRVKYVPPQKHLMPEVYIRTDGERRFYNAHNYDPVVQGIPDWAAGEELVDRWVRPYPSAPGLIHQDGIINDLYKDEDEDRTSYHFIFENEYFPNVPHEHIEEFSDIKPSIVGQTYQGLRIDVVEEFAYDRYDDNSIWETSEGGASGEYKHPHFFAKLRPLGFNLFAMATEEDMVLSMTSGHCGACQFKIKVDDNTKKNPVQTYTKDVYIYNNGSYTLYRRAGTLKRYGDERVLYTLNSQGQYVRVIEITAGRVRVDLSGNAVVSGEVGSLPSGSTNYIEGDVVTSGRFQDVQQDTTDNYVWVALEKDESTYGTLMPAALAHYQEVDYDAYIRPASVQDAGSEDDADKFVLLNIRMPQSYYRAAEHELSRALIEYMYDNNYQKYNFTVKFSRIFLEQTPYVLQHLNENSVLYIKYNRPTPYKQYASHYSYKMTNDKPLPEIVVDFNRELSVVKSFEERVIDRGDREVMRPIEGGDEDWRIGGVVRDRSRFASNNSSNYLTDYGYNVISGDIYSATTDRSLNQVIEQTGALTETVNALMQSSNSNANDVEKVVATHLLINRYSHPWPTTRFRQMFPDDYEIEESVVAAAEAAGLNIAMSDGSFHIFGSITADVTLELMDDKDSFWTDNKHASKNDAHFLCFLSDADSSVFEPTTKVNSTRQDVEGKYTRYLGFGTGTAALNALSIDILHTGETSTDVDFYVKVRLFDATEISGKDATIDACALNAMDAPCFMYNYNDGYEYNELPYVDYEYSDDYIILSQRKYATHVSGSFVQADYRYIEPYNGYGCISDGYSGLYRFDVWYSPDVVLRKIQRVDLGLLHWSEETNFEGRSVYMALLDVPAGHNCREVVTSVARSYQVCSELNSEDYRMYTAQVEVNGVRGSYMIMDKTVKGYSDVSSPTVTADGIIYASLIGVYAYYIPENNTIERI